MSGRVQEELALLQTAYPTLEYREEAGQHWVRLASWRLPPGPFDRELVEVVFQVPPDVGQAPYGFWVRPGLALPNGSAPGNYACPDTTPWGPDFGKFSWTYPDWRPTADIGQGSNMLRFVRSFHDRLREGN